MTPTRLTIIWFGPVNDIVSLTNDLIPLAHS